MLSLDIAMLGADRGEYLSFALVSARKARSAPDLYKESMLAPPLRHTGGLYCPGFTSGERHGTRPFLPRAA